VTNLVNNALKFTEKGGVTIDLSMKTKDGRSRLRFAVTDTGVGIEESRIGAIFEAFSQADQSTTRKFGGTGLGLTVCKRLVDAMGGEIIVSSVVNMGSTFSVYAELPVEKAAPPKPVMTGISVALALPSPLLSRSMVQAFRDLGREPRVIASPRDANAGEIVLTQSDLLAADGGAPGALNICLTDVGDNRVDALIRERVAVDLLPLPLGRQALWDFAGRASRSEFRGLAALAASVATGPQETFGYLSILAVDDNAVNREVLREALLSLGVEGDFVSNGLEALKAATTKTYDVVFMDGSMPEMDGFTATRLIRQHESSAQKPRAYVVALTAQVRGADADAWAAVGADRHMTKPFTSARLMEALKAAGAVQPEIAPAPVVPAKNNALINDEAVNAMEAVSARSGRDVLAKVWKLFLGQAPDAIAKLEALAGEANAAGAGKQAHFLKSMSLSAGAARLAALCETIEQKAHAGDPGAFANVADVRALADETCSAMSRRLDDRPQISAAG
jgi:two-component system sensor histidine kinase BarA